METITRAVEESTLHALPTAIASKNISKRVYWLFVFFVASAVLGYNGSLLIVRYQKQDVSTSVTMDTSGHLVSTVIYLFLFSPANTVIFQFYDEQNKYVVERDVRPKFS